MATDIGEAGSNHRVNSYVDFPQGFKIFKEHSVMILG